MFDVKDPEEVPQGLRFPAILQGQDKVKVGLVILFKKS
jgi:hypothetical protein